MLPELLIPAGNLAKLKLALAYGADAVYVGVGDFSLRPASAALTPDDLKIAAEICRTQHKKIYVALNIMAFNRELAAIEKCLHVCAAANVHGLIIGDAGVFQLARAIVPQIPRHISTQMGVANLAAAQFWANNGATRIVLARECSLADAQTIAAATSCEIEIFVHGAMCAAVAGRCLLSAHLSRQSANRGACKHACRWEYQLVENTRPQQGMEIFETGRDTIILASRDLRLIEYLPQVIASGVSALKIEGRMKSEYYIAAVTRTYRAALAAYAAAPEKFVVRDEWLAELNSFTHRPYCSGFAFGYAREALQADDNQYRATHLYLGRALDAATIWVKNPFRIGEEIEWLAPAEKNGKIIIQEIINDAASAAMFTTTAIPQTTVKIKYSGDELPAWAILRRRIQT